jgi:hypothetical protein
MMFLQHNSLVHVYKASNFLGCFSIYARDYMYIVHSSTATAGII